MKRHCQAGRCHHALATIPRDGIHASKIADQGRKSPLLVFQLFYARRLFGLRRVAADERRVDTDA